MESLSTDEFIRGKRREPGVFHGSTDSEVIERLKFVVPQAEEFMYRVVEEAADACAANSSCFRFQVEILADHAGFPEKVAVEPRTVGTQRLLEIGDHAETKDAI